MEPAQGSLLSPLIFVGFLFVFMYFMIIRPQNKRNKEIADMVAQVEKGTEVIGAGGILGKVTEVKDLYVSIEIASWNCYQTSKESAIANILPKGTIDSI